MSGIPTLPARGTQVRITGTNSAGQLIDFEGECAGYEHRVDPPIIFVRSADGRLHEGRLDPERRVGSVDVWVRMTGPFISDVIRGVGHRDEHGNFIKQYHLCGCIQPNQEAVPA